MKRAIVWSVILYLSFTSGIQSADTNPMEKVVSETYSLITRYTKKLFPSHNPFAKVFDLETGEAVFERLKVRKNSDGSLSPAPLARLSNALTQFHAHKTELDVVFIQEILDDSNTVLESEEYRQHERQSNLLALYYLLDYLRRFNIDVTPRETDKEDKKNDKKDKENKQKQKPTYPDLPNTYKPHTKDTEKEPGSKEDQVRIAEVNFATAYFGQRYFAEIIRGANSPFQEINLPMTFSSPGTARSTSREMIVHSLGQEEVTLFLPPSHSPYQPVDPRAQIGRNLAGGYTLRVDDPSLDNIHIPLDPIRAEFLQPHIREIYTRTVGFDFNEWPPLVRSDLFATFDPSIDHSENPLPVAQAIANHIARRYLYSVGARAHTDPIDALNDGAFQCDMAAYCMVGLLRDVYHIPSRVVGGFRAKKYQKGKDQKSYLVLPGEGHSWIEVYAQGAWHPFDPTPLKKDKKEEEDESGEKDEYSDRSLDNQPKPEPEPESKSSKQKDESDKEADQDPKKDGLKRLEDDTLERLKTLEEQGTHDESMDHQELAHLLELGSLEMEPSLETNPLRNRAYRFVLQMVLDPNLNGDVIAEHLHRMGALFRGLPDQEGRALYLNALRIHQKNHPKIDNWLSEISNLLSFRDIATSYKEIYTARQALLLFTQLIDRSVVPYPSTLLSHLNKVVADIHNLAHADSRNIALVNGFLNSLPSMVQELLRRDYGLSQVGPNAPTRKIAQLLREGSLQDYRLLAILSPLTDFVTNAHPRPEYEEVRTWLRETRRPQGTDLLPLQRFSEIAKAVYLHPALGPEHNIKHQTAYVPVTRMRTLIPTGFGKEDAERITIVLYDTSGSMAGELAKFQAGLISAFTARAISDISPSGRHRHKVVLIPFDDGPGTPVKITNTDEALEVLRNYTQKLANTGGGTDIQKALLQALALIADAEQRAGEPLAAANIVLMTDGQSDINVDELAKARNAIDRQTPVQSMFVAIGSTNQELINFAQESDKAGFERGMYREFTNKHISELLREATTRIPDVDDSSIYSEHQASDIPWETANTLDQAIALAQELAASVRQTYYYQTPAEHLQQLEGVGLTEVEHINRPLETWLKDVRKFAYNNVFKDRTLLQRMVNDLVINFKALTGIDIHEMSSYELEELRHFLRFADSQEK